MPALCETCQKFGLFQHSFDPQETIELPVEKHHKNIKGLRLSAEAECPFCKIVWDDYRNRTLKGSSRWSSTNGDEILTLADAAEIKLRSNYRPSLGDGVWEVTLFFDAPFVLEGFERTFHARIDFTPFGDEKGTNSPRPKGWGHKLKSLLKKDPIESQSISAATDSKTLDKGTSSVLSVNMAKHWIDTCCQSHPHCKSEPELQTWHPTRLVLVGSLDKPSLSLQVGKQIPSSASYVSLSHCWGKIKMFKLLTGNLEELQKSIPFDQLCKTFQEAMQFTRSLAIEYVWIDSLCIIQDSSEDWRKESGSMEKVYQAAVCNLAAASSSDGTGGLSGSIRKRDLNCVMPIYHNFRGWKWSQQGKNKAKTELKGSFVVTGNSEDWWENHIKETPLAKRGWVFQEFLLARRTVYFGFNQILFECSQHRCCETFPNGLPKHLQYTADMFMESNRLKKPLGWQSGAEYKTLKDVFPVAFINWGQLIWGYTNLALTYDTDKLPAISGVARQFQKTMKCRYLAGLWEDNLLAQLLWSSTYQGLTRPTGYRAPSWSWAAFNGPIRSDFSNAATMSKDWTKRNPKTDVVFSEVIEAQTTPMGPSEAGEVKDGFIRMRGRLVPVTMIFTGERDDLRNPRMVEIESPEPDLDMEITVDVLTEMARTPLEGVYFCAPFSLKNSEPISIRGLLIRATGRRRGEFERVGIFNGLEKTIRHFTSEERKKDVVAQKFFISRDEEQGFPVFQFTIV